MGTGDRGTPALGRLVGRERRHRRGVRRSVGRSVRVRLASRKRSWRPSGRVCIPALARRSAVRRRGGADRGRGASGVRSSVGDGVGTGVASFRPAPTARSTCCSWWASTPLRLPRCRAGSGTGPAGTSSAGRAVTRALALSSRTPTRSSRRPRSWRRTGMSPRGKGRSHADQRLSAGRRASRCQTGEIFASLGARVQQATSAPRPSDELHEDDGFLPGATRAARYGRCGHRGTGPSAPPGDPRGLPASLHLPAVSWTEAACLERSDELKAALEEGLRSSTSIRTTPRRVRAFGPRPPGDRCAPPPGRPKLPVRVTDHVAEGAVFVPFSQPGVRGQHDPRPPRSRSAPTSSPA